jgi:hypothetical protein
VAEALTVNQPAVAKLEKRGDMRVSNLRRYIEALGGTLEITERFDKTTVVTSRRNRCRRLHRFRNASRGQAP